MSTLFGVVLIVLALHDSFETLVLPRRVTRRWRLTRIYFVAAWKLWRHIAMAIPRGRHRENVLSAFGPFALLGLVTLWVSILITGFSLIHWGRGDLTGGAGDRFTDCLYHSGETFFTLGYGDITPATSSGKLLVVVEAGMGFGFIAVVIGYLPVLAQAFSRREVNISLLDARAGSPPSAGELWRRATPAAPHESIARFLGEWELWCAELLESHLSFPMLSFYRSQHDNQSWLAALAVVLDTSALLLTGGAPECRHRAQLTFAIARHACVDLCLVFWLPPQAPPEPRLTDAERDQIFRGEGGQATLSAEQRERLADLRAIYEPFLHVLAEYFSLRLPRFMPDRPAPDNWQTSPWTPRAPALTKLADLVDDVDDAQQHFG